MSRHDASRVGAEGRATAYHAAHVHVTPACCCRLQPPQLKQKDGQLHVTLRLRRGADLSSVLRELASSMGAAGRGDKGAAVREGDLNMQVRRAASVRTCSCQRLQV